MIANMLLVKYRDIRIKAMVQNAECTVMDLASLSIQASIEGLERLVNEFLNQIRAEIGECIFRLEKD
jgi:hypothetical protein